LPLWPFLFFFSPFYVGSVRSIKLNRLRNSSPNALAIRYIFYEYYQLNAFYRNLYLARASVNNSDSIFVYKNNYLFKPMNYNYRLLFQEYNTYFAIAGFNTFMRYD